jgi:small-conductance mechanosensitive channel
VCDALSAQAISVATHGQPGHLSALVVEAATILVLAGFVARVVRWATHAYGLDEVARRKGSAAAAAVSDTLADVTDVAAPPTVQDEMLEPPAGEAAPQSGGGAPAEKRHAPPPRLLHAYLTRPVTTLVWATAAAAVARCAQRAASATWLHGEPVTVLGVPAVALLWGAWRLALIACAAWAAILASGAALDRAAARHPRHAASWHAARDTAHRALLIAAALAALSVLRVPLSALLTFGGVGGVVLGVGAQAAAANALSGGFLMLSHALHEGDYIEMVGKGLAGTVTDFSLTSTTILSRDATCVSLPNAELSKTPLRNFSRASAIAVAGDFPVALSRLDDVGDALERMEAFLAAHPHVETTVAGGRLRSAASLGEMRDGHITLSVRAYVATQDRSSAELERIRRDVLLGLGRVITHDAGIPLAPPVLSVVASSVVPRGTGSGGGGGAASASEQQQDLMRDASSAEDAADAPEATLPPPPTAMSAGRRGGMVHVPFALRPSVRWRRPSHFVDGRPGGGDISAAEVAAEAAAAAAAREAHEEMAFRWRGGELEAGG